MYLSIRIPRQHNSSLNLLIYTKLTISISIWSEILAFKLWSVVILQLISMEPAFHEGSSGDGGRKCEIQYTFMCFICNLIISDVYVILCYFMHIICSTHLILCMPVTAVVAIFTEVLSIFSGGDMWKGETHRREKHRIKTKKPSFICYPRISAPGCYKPETTHFRRCIHLYLLALAFHFPVLWEA